MLDLILNEIEEWMRDLFTGMTMTNLETMYTDVNQRTGEIAAQVAATPQDWNGNIFSMIRTLSDTVMMPIAGMIITFVLCYELISMLTEKNTMHDIDTWMFFKYFVKMWIAVFIVSHTFEITMAVFDVGKHIVDSAAGVISRDTTVDVSDMVQKFSGQAEEMKLSELFVLALESFIVSFGMKILSVVITVILYARMIEIYLYISVSPVTFSTFGNREWGQIGNNYLKGLVALAFQGFFIIICVGIYAVLISVVQYSDNLHLAMFEVGAYTVILCLSLMKTGSLAREVFSAR